MKKIFAIVLLCLSCTGFAYPRHSADLKPVIEKFYQLEEAKHLIEQVEKEGSITIQTRYLGKNASNAVWIPDIRTIYLNVSQKRTLSSLLCSVVFELHNALRGQEFNYYDTMAIEGKISKNQYIEAIEYIEYTNTLHTAQLLNQGIRKGIFPRDAFWPTAPSFYEHFQVQIQSGHSALIAQNYDCMIQPQLLAKNEPIPIFKKNDF